MGPVTAVCHVHRLVYLSASLLLPARCLHLVLSTGDNTAGYAHSTTLTTFVCALERVGIGVATLVS